MGMQIDEPRCLHVPLGINGLFSLKWLVRHGFNAATNHTDVSNGIQFGLRIDHSTIRNDEIVFLSAARTMSQEYQKR